MQAAAEGFIMGEAARAQDDSRVSSDAAQASLRTDNNTRGSSAVEDDFLKARFEPDRNPMVLENSH
jgi:hypothetical protein